MNHFLKFLCMAALLAFPLTVYCGATDTDKPAASSSNSPAVTTHPAAPLDEKPVAQENLTGKVLQTMNSGGYTYVYLETKEQKVWIAAPQTTARVGETMSFKPGMKMSNFPSTSLKRTFDTIIFSDGVISGADEVKKAEKSPGSSGAVIKSGKIKVEKATGKNTYTVSELFSKSAKLNNKKIVVRGKVIKVSANIMNKNWIHIQDGSGNENKGTHNLVVTSQDTPTVGDVVTVSGTLHKDKDFGGNYKYKVLIEEATIKP